MTIGDVLEEVQKNDPYADEEYYKQDCDLPSWYCLIGPEVDPITTIWR